ncbi:MAG: hypothetical protein A2Z34_06500 [Planctomycetes bacterium RBG_16_59_8]|nr:MAG: hypothetical protein A2Z34_06500 [Planctomycetes bacterium RBG_16_59_8]
MLPVAMLLALAALVAPPALFAQEEDPPVPDPAPVLTVSIMDLYNFSVHLRLDWTDSDNEDAYKIYRTQDESKLADFPASWQYIDTVSTGTTIYHDYQVQPYDEFLNPKGTYYYKILAVNTAGETESNVSYETMPALNIQAKGDHSGICFIDASGKGAGSGPTGLLLLSLCALLLAAFHRRTRMPTSGFSR